MDETAANEQIAAEGEQPGEQPAAETDRIHLVMRMRACCSLYVCCQSAADVRGRKL